MDWQDVLSLIVFLVLVSFSKKRKTTEEEASETDDVPSIDTVRKRIEALKRQRSGAPKKEVPAKERPIFSAYKHLPKTEIVGNIPATEPISIAPTVEKPKETLKSIDLPRKTSRLRNWVMGQVILEEPAYKRYGNFIHR